MSLTDWMRDGRFGLMVHYLSDMPGGADRVDPPVPMTPELWNAQVDAFDAEALAEQVASTGAAWLIFTIGQCSGYFCSPNTTYDSIVERRPSRLSARDLIADVAAALARRNVRTIAYLPSHAPAKDREAVEALRCTPSWDASHWQLRPGTYLRTADTDDRLTDFQRHWEAIIREWSLRWGDAIRGWWIDGCYFADKMYRHDTEPNFASFAEALRAGHPDSIIAFNSGVKLVNLCPEEDFTAGETMHFLTVAQWEGGYAPLQPRTGTALTHVLTHLGSSWRQGDRPRFNDALTLGYTQYLNNCGGAITWDVPIDAAGVIPQPFIDQLTLIRNSNP